MTEQNKINARAKLKYARLYCQRKKQDILRMETSKRAIQFKKRIINKLSNNLLKKYFRRKEKYIIIRKLKINGRQIAKFFVRIKCPKQKIKKGMIQGST